MLEQVREAGTSLRFGAEAHVVVDRDTDDRRRPVRGDDDPQAVVEGRAVQFSNSGSHCVNLP